MATAEPIEIKLKCDDTPLMAFIEFIKNFLNSSLNRVDPLPEIPEDLVRIDTIQTTAVTNELVVVLYPSDALIRYGSALGASEGELSSFVKVSHKETSRTNNNANLTQG